MDCLDSRIDTLTASPYSLLSTDSLNLHRIGAFQNEVQRSTLSSHWQALSSIVEDAWKPIFWAERATVVKALRAEQGLKGRKFSLVEWMKSRVLTIAGNRRLLLEVHTFTLAYSIPGSSLLCPGTRSTRTRPIARL